MAAPKKYQTDEERLEARRARAREYAARRYADIKAGKVVPHRDSRSAGRVHVDNSARQAAYRSRMVDTAGTPGVADQLSVMLRRPGVFHCVGQKVRLALLRRGLIEQVDTSGESVLYGNGWILTPLGVLLAYRLSILPYEQHDAGSDDAGRKNRSALAPEVRARSSPLPRLASKR